MPEKRLHEFVEDVSGQSHLRVEHDFGDGYVRLQTSEAERRQAAQDIRSSEDVLIELLRNSRDAHASHLFVASSKEGNRRIITVIDDGDGIPASMHEHVFEPRVTSKLDTSHMDAWGLHGRGMALFSIRENVETAKVELSGEGLGCSIGITSDTMALSEKRDQSTFPTFELTDEKTVNVRGPKNLIRTACEFAIEARDDCSVVFGSPTEVAAALFEYGASNLSAIDRAFCRDASHLPLVKRFATASDPRELQELCESCGLVISERSARRILDGQIEAASSLISRISIDNPRTPRQKASRSAHQGQRIRLDGEERRVLADSVMTAYSEIAERFYLEPDVAPEVRALPDRITISIPVVKKQ